MRSNGSPTRDDFRPDPGPQIPGVSAIVANYNAGPFLEACLRSILAQQGVDLDVVVVDDVSTDDGVAIARRMAERDDRVRVVEMARNGGPAAARNLALSMARGDWVAIVDSDDLLHPQRFARLVAAAEGAAVDMIADDLLVFTDGSDAPPRRFLKPTDRGAPFCLALDDYLNRSILYGAEPNPGFLKPIIRRDRLLSSGVRYDETLRIAEDDDLAVRLLLAGFQYLVVPTPWYFYRKHAASISHRLSLAAIEAIQAADARLGAAISLERPELARACAARRRAFRRAAAFEALILAIRRRDVGRAAGLIARNPTIVPMMRMPLTGLVRKVAARRADRPVSSGLQQRRLLDAAERAGASRDTP